MTANRVPAPDELRTSLSPELVGRLVGIVLDRGPLTVEDAAAALGADVAAVAEIVSGLAAAGIVQRPGVEGHLLAGPAVLRFRGRGIDRAALCDLARDLLRQLADETGETVNLMMPSRGRCVAVAQEAGRRYLGAYNWLEEELEPHCTAGGKVFLAAGTLAPAAGELTRHTAATITDPATLERELATVRARGWAMLVEELEQGLSALAAPVRDGSDEVVAALSVSGPTARLGAERMQVLGPIVVAHAGELSVRLGHPDRRWTAETSYSHEID